MLAEEVVVGAATLHAAVDRFRQEGQQAPPQGGRLVPGQLGEAHWREAGSEVEEALAGY